jgi:hypothetical protein
MKDYSLASSFAIFLLFCPLLAFMHLFQSEPSSLFPPKCKIPKETPSKRKRKEKKHKNNIEGYINSYIQKSKKEAKARTRKKQGGEGGMMEPQSDLEENKPTRASPVKLLISYRQDRNTCTRGLQKGGGMISMCSASSRIRWRSTVERAGVESHW